MKKLSFLILATSLLISCTNIEQRRNDVLDYFKGLSSKTDKRFVSGQFINWGKNASMNDVNTIHERSGEWVGFLGADYHSLDYNRDHWVHNYISSNLATTNKIIIDYGVPFCFFSMHFNNPFTDSSAWDTTGNLKVLLTDNALRKKLDSQMDSMALGFEELQQKGIIICLRPLHEVNGGWFWWGNKDSLDVIALYRYIHDYFIQTKKLKNLIWCYSPCLWPVKYMTWYPGDDYVDIVCIDAYTQTIYPYADQVYKEISAINKPIGIAEFGPCDPSDWEGKKPCTYDMNVLLNEVRQHYPKFTFFMTWDQHWSMANHNQLKEMLTDPWVANKQDVLKALK